MGGAYCGGLPHSLFNAYSSATDYRRQSTAPTVPTCTVVGTVLVPSIATFVFCCKFVNILLRGLLGQTFLIRPMCSVTQVYICIPVTNLQVSCKAGRFYSHSNWAFTRYDRRTDRSVRLVCPTGRTDRPVGRPITLQRRRYFLLTS